MKALIFCLPIFPLLLGCSNADTVLKDDYHVQGTVTNAVSQQPLAGVEVTLLEDREIINGGTLLRTATTDQNGRYAFDFTWKDSPYEVYVKKEGYLYTRPVVNNLTDDTLWVPYQQVEFGKHQSQIDFKMKLIDNVIVTLKNVPPAEGSDKLELVVRKSRTGPIYMGPFVEMGLIEKKLHLGRLQPYSYVFFEYEVMRQGHITQYLDSVQVLPNIVVPFALEF